MSSTLHYCSCNPASKSNREPSKWYCYRHRRHLCDNCIYDDLNQRHISCLVGTYDQFIKAGPTTYSRYKNKCPICSVILPEDAMLVIRLNCACVYHAKCLQEYLLSKASNNNVECVKCKKLIADKHQTSSSINMQSKKSNLSESVNKFLRSISRQRLWNKPKNINKAIKTETASSNISTPNIESNINQAKREHVLLDTQTITRHRSTVKTSSNKDGNLEDDKYNKHKKARKSGKTTSKRWSTRKILVVLFLVFAFIAQIYFLYLIFGTNKDNNTHIINQQGQNQQQSFYDKLKNNEKLNGLVDNLPDNLKEQLFGNKVKMQNMQKRLID